MRLRNHHRTFKIRARDLSIMLYIIQYINSYTSFHTQRLLVQNDIKQHSCTKKMLKHTDSFNMDTSEIAITQLLYIYIAKRE